MIPTHITVAMMKVPDGKSWMAQIHIEHEGRKGKEVLPLKGDNPIQLLNYCTLKLQKKLEMDAAKTN